ncbi:hypothetical protein SK128_018128 [Halocaridina rubra]|uniref:Uncharacterized protein n=1 Tax=Halocaridina rubra TaxID=373956 RepID=A0AAN8WLN2_HALRR
MACYDGVEEPTDEAEYTLSVTAKNKEFWELSLSDNHDILQNAIDIKYNSIRGNKYSVVYVGYEKYEYMRKLGIHCEICNMMLFSTDSVLFHERGEHHKKVQQQILISNPNLQTILKRRKCNTHKGIYPDNSLEHLIDTSQRTVLGVHFVYKVGLDETELFTCQLCSREKHTTDLHAEDMLKHLTSSSHNRNYLKVKFGYRDLDYNQYKSIANYTEEREGKINAPISELTKQCIINVNKGEVSRHFEDSDSRDTKNLWKTKEKNSLKAEEMSGIVPLSFSIHDSSSSTQSSPVPPPIPPCIKPLTIDVGIAVDMYNTPRNITDSILILRRVSVAHNPLLY